MIRLALALCLTSCAAYVNAADAPARRLLTPDDLYRVEDISDPQVSPDGLWVAYVVTLNDRESDEAHAAIWMVSWDGTQRLSLTAAADGTAKPRWSPDGRYISFLSTPTGSEKPQLMLLDRRGGDARALTKVEGDIGEYAWAPDGKRLVFTMVQGAAGTAPKPIVIDALHFKQDEDGYLGAGSARHLYLCDVGEKRVDALTADPQFNEDLPTWSPNGRQIAFIRTHERGPDSDGREDIDVIEPATGAVPRRIERPFAPNNQKLEWSPDGSLIAYLEGLEPKFNAYMQDRLAVVAAAGGSVRPLTDALDRAVMSYAFAADSASIVIAVEDDGAVYPARIDLKSGSVVRLYTASSVISAISSGGGHMALIESNDGALAEVSALEADKLRRLTAHNEPFLGELQLGAVEELRFKSRDGAQIHGLLVKPPSYVPGRKYPTVLWIHGGTSTCRSTAVSRCIRRCAHWKCPHNSSSTPGSIMYSPGRASSSILPGACRTGSIAT
jgi:dipeptidyl aminopeptidase/acylaminoacyl peptidase